MSLFNEILLIVAITDIVALVASIVYVYYHKEKQR